MRPQFAGRAVHPGPERQPVQRCGHPAVQWERVRTFGAEVQLQRDREGAQLASNSPLGGHVLTMAYSASVLRSTTLGRC